ncbi:MAG TPA: isopeptide-forming domain-containing fimbrial protein [Candidatus Dojkabacteria bacterium]|nr:isopeptide-forming domain-containing fimbrial protein [Candidatus Dojkabacteria bacterium]
MEEEIKVTTKKKTSKTVKILLIITGILGLALVAVAIYFYSIADTSKDDEIKQTTCGCYYIDPSVVSECGDPKRGFIFETVTVPSTQTCKAACSTSKLSVNILNSTTEQDLYQICQLPSILDSRCTEMVIKDSTGKIVTGKVSANDVLSVEAKFNQEYIDYQFTINNETKLPDTISTDKLSITKSIADLSGITTLNIVATGKTSTGEQINSPLCRRLIEVAQDGVKNVSGIQIQTRTVDTKLKIAKIKINASNITDEAKVTLKFSFSNNFPTLSMKEGFTANKTKGEIEIVEQDLYNSSNFTEVKSFSQLDNHKGELTITATVLENGKSLGSVSKAITFPETSSNVENPDADTTEESNFTIAKTASEQCVERVAPNNFVTFTLTSTNRGTISQGITSVKDKLPLGFTYVANSSKINNVVVTDSNYVTVSTIGSTQEIVWTKTEPWIVNSNQALTITFNAIAGGNALTGKNTNEVILTPQQIPADPSSLRATATLLVQQDCDNPEEEIPEVPVNPDEDIPQTGIFDSVISKVILGILTITFGWYIYSKPSGRVLAEKLIETPAFKGAEMTTWKIFKPKKYFEEKIINKISKVNQKKR